MSSTTDFWDRKLLFQAIQLGHRNGIFIFMPIYVVFFFFFYFFPVEAISYSACSSV